MLHCYGGDNNCFNHCDKLAKKAKYSNPVGNQHPKAANLDLMVGLVM